MRAINAIRPRTFEAATQPAAAFEAVYREHFDYVWACLRHLGVPEPACDDAVQDVFLVVHRRLPEFDWNNSIRTWLFEIARRVAARHRRTDARTDRRRAALAHEPRLAEAPTPDEDVARQQVGQILFEFLDDLDEDKRTVFVLAHLEELRGPEIADALGIPVNTVYSRLRAANERFDKRCKHLQIQERRVLDQGREHARAPAGAQQRAWLLLAPQVGLASKTAAAVGATGLIANAKIFALTVLLGAGTVFGVRAATEPEEPKTEASVAAAGAELEPELADARPKPRATHDPEPAPESEPEPELQAPTPPPTIQRPKAERPDPEPAESPAVRLEREAALLASMKSALTRNDPAAALRYADDHAREFPSGQLAADRSGYRAIALCKLGRDREGRGAAKLYLGANPSAALANRVKDACGV